MNCPVCGSDINKEYRFCPACGTKVPARTDEVSQTSSDRVIICDICGEENSEDSIHCTSCGSKLKENGVIKKTGSPQKAVTPKQEKDSKVKEHYKKDIKPKQETTKKHETVKKAGNNISTLNILVLIAGLLLLGYVILDLAGVFESAIPTQVDNVSAPGSSQINLAEIEKINQLEKEVLMDTTKTDLVLELAHKLGDSGFNDRSVKYYEMYLRKNPTNADVNVDLGVVFFELKQYSKAKSMMMKGLDLNPTHQIASFNIGVVNSAEGKLDSAKIWWNKAVELNPATQIGRRAQELLNSH